MEAKMNNKFKDIEVCKVHDMNGDASHVTIQIVSPDFKGMLPLARHRAINELLKDEIK